MLVSYPMAKKPQNILLSITSFKGIYNDWKELFKVRAIRYRLPNKTNTDFTKRLNKTPLTGKLL